MSDTNMPDTFIARQPGDLEIVLPRAMVEKALGMLARTTNAPEFRDAMELVWFKCDPREDPTMWDHIAMLVTLYRSAMDGNVRPPVDLAELYSDIYRQQQDNGVHPGGPAP